MTACYALAAFAVLGACQQSVPPASESAPASSSEQPKLSDLKAQPPALDAVEAGRIVDTARSIAKPGSTVRAVCGNSIGSGYYGPDDGWVVDRVDGHFAIVQDIQGVADMIWSSAINGFQSARYAGATIEIIKDEEGEIILMLNDQGRVAESYIIKGSGYSAMAITTAVKQEIGPVPARGRVLIASCFVPIQ